MHEQPTRNGPARRRRHCWSPFAAPPPRLSLLSSYPWTTTMRNLKTVTTHATPPAICTGQLPRRSAVTRRLPARHQRAERVEPDLLGPIRRQETAQLNRRQAL